MHYRGFAIVPEPTEEAVEEVMQGHGDGHRWDWYRCGGREDGYLHGDEEMKVRETHNGFNFDDSNKSVRRNCCKVRDLPTDRRSIYFFAVGHHWVDRELFVDGYPDCRFEENKLFVEQFENALIDHPDSWVVVIDAHN